MSKKRVQVNHGGEPKDERAEAIVWLRDIWPVYERQVKEEIERSAA